MGCCGGGDQTVTTQNTYEAADPEAALRMAGVAESAEARSEEQWNNYRNIFLPYEKQMVEANQKLLPILTNLSEKNLKTQYELMPLRDNVQRLGLEEQQSDILMNRPVKQALVEQQLAELNQSAPVSEKFYKEVIDGKNVNETMGAAHADTALGFQMAEGDMKRDLNRLGVRSGSDRFNRAIETVAMNKAKAIGSARTHARRDAEAENFNRLSAGMGVRGRATGLPGTTNTGVSATGATPFYGGVNQVGNYTLTSPVANSVSWQNNAIGANQAGMQKYNVGSVTTSPSQDPGFMGMFGNVIGQGAGSYMSGYGNAAGAKAGGAVAGGVGG